MSPAFLSQQSGQDGKQPAFHLFSYLFMIFKFRLSLVMHYDNHCMTTR